MEKSTRVVVFLLFGFLTLAICSGDSDVVCFERERQALLRFKQDLKDPSNRLFSWASEGDCCSWTGVHCDNLTGHVIKLQLRNPYDSDHLSDDEFEAYERFKLGGEINPSLVELKHLNYLDLSQNDFGGIPIPKIFGSMVNLRYLNLSEAGFEGMILHQLGNLSNLHYLSLRGPYWYPEAKLTVENLQWLSNLSSLQHLDMSQVNLNKASDWLQVTNMLTSLLELHLSYCELQVIPPLSYFNFTSLSILDLSGNRVFDVSDNGLNSSIPHSLFSLNGLSYLILLGNNFRGPIPLALQNMTGQRVLELSGNYFNSIIPDELYNFSSLEILSLSHNNLQGTISSAIGNMTSLTFLGLSYNDLEGGLPRSIVNLCNLQVLSLASNRLNKTIPERLGQLSKLEELYISDNFFEGVVSEAHFANLKRLNFLLASSNSSVMKVGSDWIPPFQLTYIGDIPDCWMNWQSLTMVKLGNNNLTGNLPSSMGSLSGLKSLHLRNNSLSGKLPMSLQNCKELLTMDLGGNQFSGNIPTWIGKSLSRLIVLSFRANKFNGDIPRELCHLYSLQILDLAHNKLSGTMSRCFNNFSAMATKQNSSEVLSYYIYFGEFVETAILMTKGREFEYGNTLTLVTSMDLSGNILSGEISEEITSLLGLRSLNLSDNRLTGKIPEKIGNMGLLESLDFSRNQLSGVIPGSLSSLSFLSHLNLSYNSLTGKIPTSTQLQSLNASSFLGNNLCGPPLTENCTGGQDLTPNHGGVGEDKDDDKFELSFFVSMALGDLIACDLINGEAKLASLVLCSAPHLCSRINVGEGAMNDVSTHLFQVDQMANWSELQKDLLGFIAKRLITYEDFVAFSGVCSSWRLVAMNVNFTRSIGIPWLMLVQKDSDTRRFFSLSKGLVHERTLTETRDTKCWGSQGWLITIGEFLNINLLNPLTRLQIQLPHQCTFKDKDLGHSSFHTQKFYIIKAILSSSPSCTSNYVVMVIHSEKSKLAFARPGDKTWTTINSRFARFSDVAFFRGQFYAINLSGAVVACDIEGPNPAKARLVAKASRKLIGFYMKLRRNLYIVESSGELLVVSRVLTKSEPVEISRTIYYQTIGFRVFSLDLVKRKWAEVKSLGERALFLGDSSSMSIVASHYLGCQPNCIYFTDDSYGYYSYYSDGGGKDMGIFNMEDKSIKPHYRIDPSCLCKLAPPMWVVPSL
ncbi:hypothetical protein HHK36_000233 [Tetracentron sinense]|uniref:Leucine-rich repeat-containing N-terminal plant-type domain-containing protein n=1 Tax=Tetracentron sinense TaxID=13715 RepID=A0A834ZTR8_TETSI|nr:hypothetical protein HHK36_000233 [Tetracentron sinense]